jgi:2-phosphoglycolate phosphatase
MSISTPVRYAAYLFDLDGTLLDSAQTFWVILNQMRADRNLPPLEFAPVRMATAKGANALIAASFAVPENPEEFNELKKQFLDAYRAHIMQNTPELFAGIEEILQHLNQNKMPWGIVTNKHEKFTHLILKKHALLSTAHTVVSGDTMPQSKPHSAPLLHASEKMKTSPSNMVFIGDHFFDIKAGRSAGMATGLALYGYLAADATPKSWGADYFFADPNEIYQWLIKNNSDKST